MKTDVGGVACYEDDHYHQVSHDIASVPSNPWFICTLWVAQWRIATARTAGDLASAEELLRWVADHALLSEILAEQVHPCTAEPLSVSPLTSSHAAVVATVQSYVAKRDQIAATPDAKQDA